MCRECLKTPCDNRCPNAPEPPPVGYCDHCHCTIYDEDRVYLLNHEIWCEDCIEAAKIYASKFTLTGE